MRGIDPSIGARLRYEDKIVPRQQGVKYGGPMSWLLHSPSFLNELSGALVTFVHLFPIVSLVNSFQMSSECNPCCQQPLLEQEGQ